MNDSNEQLEVLTEGTFAEAPAEAAETPAAAPEAPAAPEVAPEVVAQEQKFAAKFAALSRKEKALRQKEAQLEARLKEMESQYKTKESEITTKYIDPERFRKEPLKVIEETGLSFEKLAEMVLNDGKPTQDMVLNEYEKKMMAKMQELENKLAEKEAKEQEEKYSQAVSQFQAQLTDFVNKTEDYELIRAQDAVGLVFEVIEQHHQETGQILSNKEASDAVEEYLFEEAKKLVDREKVKKLLQPQAPAKPVEPKGKPSPTLSNANAVQAPKSTAKQLSAEESIANAAKLIRWND